MNENFPIVTVIITTHNRTKIAKAVIYSLIKNLKYPNLKWCIADDRSKSDHIQQLVNQFNMYGINDVLIIKSNKDRYGLGATLNMALDMAFKLSPLVLRTEDDWILEKPLDIKPYVDILLENNYAFAVRLAVIGQAHTINCKKENVVKVIGDTIYSSIFNLQVALCHKRAYDILGKYPEKVSSDEVEAALKNKFNKLTYFGTQKYSVYFPNNIKQHTLDDPSLYFIHVGLSTVGHTQYKIPNRYLYLYDMPKTIQPKNKILVFSAGTKNLEFQYKLTNANKELYCKKYNYEFKFFQLSESDKKSFHCRKQIILDIINSEKYDWILWMDCDAWFNNFDISIDSIISKYGKPGISLIVARDHYIINNSKQWHDCYINSGVLLVKCDDYAKNIIKIWNNPSQHAKEWMQKHTVLNDQPYLSILLLWDSFTKEHSSIVNYSIMNTFARLGFDKSTFICHVPGKKGIQDRNWYLNHFITLFNKSKQNWTSN